MARHFLRSAMRRLNATVEDQISTIVHPHLSSLLSVPCLAGSNGISEGHHTSLDFNKDFSILHSKRRMGDRMTSEYVEEENKGFWNRSDRDLKHDMQIDFDAECPRWLIDKKGREWRAAIPRFVEGVIVELTTRKPIKPNSGNRKIAKVQVTLNGRSRVVSARIPGENNTLQLHHRVLVQWGRAKNLPDVKFVVVRGHLDAQY